MICSRAVGRTSVGRAVVVVAASGSLLASACSSSKAGVAVARPTIATAVESTTTTNPYAVPPVIDVAYVNRVLAGLDAAVGDVVRFVVKTNPPVHELTLQLKPFYNDRTLILQLESFHQDAANHYSGYRDNPGNEKSTITDLSAAGPTCIFAHVARDYGLVAQKPNPDLADQWIAIVPNDPTRDPDHHNPTGWSYIYEGYEIGHVKPKNPCDATS